MTDGRREARSQLFGDGAGSIDVRPGGVPDVENMDFARTDREDQPVRLEDKLAEVNAGKRGVLAR